MGLTEFSNVNKFEYYIHKFLNPILLREIPEDQKDIDFNELADMWQKELQADIDSFSKQAKLASQKSSNGEPRSRMNMRRQTINKEVILSQLQGSLNIIDSVIPQENIRAVREGQTGVADQYKRQEKFKRIGREAEKRIKKQNLRRKSVFNWFDDYWGLGKFFRGGFGP